MSDSDRERAEADRRYNEALTMLDRSLVPSSDRAPVVTPPDLTPPTPRGWRKSWIRAVHEWLTPIVERQRTFNAQVADALHARSAADVHRDADLQRFQTALIVFLQQITAYVDTRDRMVGEEAASAIDRHERALEPIPDLAARVAILQRATQMLTRERSASVSESSERPSALPSDARSASEARSTSSPYDYQYVAFEDRFRGSDEEIQEKLRGYIPLFASATDVLDIGCGRGEFLALLQASGIRGRGVDVNSEMVASARERGVEAIACDALAYLESLADRSLGGIIAAQVVEHLQPAYLLRLLSTAFAKLRPDAPIVVETINPACWLAFFSSYIRDITHVRPVHPETLQYMLQANGFGNVSIRYSAPVPEHMKMQPVTLASELADAAHTLNANAAILNNLLFSYFDYAAIGYRT